MSQNADSVEQKVNSADNSKALLDLIQNISTKMNVKDTQKNNNQEFKEEKTSTYNNENTNDSSVNYSNINENASNSDNSNEENEKKASNNFDLSNISSLLSNMDLSSILGAFTSNSNQNGETNKGFDASTINNMQNMFSSATRENPKKNLLLSLKPFLRKSRQDKLSEYMTMLTVADALGIFNSKGSD